MKQGSWNERFGEFGESFVIFNFLFLLPTG